MGVAYRAGDLESAIQASEARVAAAPENAVYLALAADAGDEAIAERLRRTGKPVTLVTRYGEPTAD